jgi:hypothetical protein
MSEGFSKRWQNRGDATPFTLKPEPPFTLK